MTFGSALVTVVYRSIYYECHEALLCVLLYVHVQEYVKKHKQHPFLPVTRVAQGQHNLQFEAAFDDNAPVSETVL